jgi:hypothetical protein
MVKTNALESQYTIIARALKRFKSHSFLNRYGGMMQDYYLAVSALEALEKIREPQIEMDLKTRCDHPRYAIEQYNKGKSSCMLCGETW